MIDLDELLYSLAPEAAPDEDIVAHHRAGVRHAARRAGAGQGVASTLPPHQRRSSRLILTLAAAAVVVIAGLAYVTQKVDRVRSPSVPMDSAPGGSVGDVAPSSPVTTDVTTTAAGVEPELLDALNLYVSTVPYLSGESAELRGRVREQLMAQCMATGGFDYVPVPRWEQDRVVAELNGGWQGLLPVPSADEIAGAGYQAWLIPEYSHPALDAAAASNEALLSKEDAWKAMEGADAPFTPGVQGFARSGLRVGADKPVGLRAALRSGVQGSNQIAPGEHGCNGSVTDYMDSRVHFSAETQYYALVAQAGEVFPTDETTSDPAMIAMTQQWLACMSDAGFSPLRPWTMLNVYRRDPGTSPTSDEINVATADARCRASTGLREQYVDLVIARIPAWVSDNAAALSEIQVSLDRETTELRALAVELGVAP